MFKRTSRARAPLVALRLALPGGPARLIAGATLAPLFVAFLFAQRYFVQGIALSGLKE